MVRHGSHYLWAAAPGIIGMLGTICGKAGVNIANFQLGRDRPAEGPIVGPDPLEQAGPLEPVGPRLTHDSSSAGGRRVGFPAVFLGAGGGGAGVRGPGA